MAISKHICTSTYVHKQVETSGPLQMPFRLKGRLQQDAQATQSFGLLAGLLDSWTSGPQSSGATRFALAYVSCKRSYLLLCLEFRVGAGPALSGTW